MTFSKDFTAVCRAQASCSETTKTVKIATASVSSEAGVSPFSSPGKSQKLDYFRNLSSAEVDKTVHELQSGSSND